MLSWTVRFSVDPSWVADGFDLTDDRAKEMIEKDLSYSYGFETKAKVLTRPDQKLVKGLQDGSIDYE